MVLKLYPNNSATLTSHSDPSRCSQMLPDRLNAKRGVLRCSEAAFRMLLNTPEAVEQNPQYPEECIVVFKNLPTKTIRK
jgi:hypothetical protein